MDEKTLMLIRIRQVEAGGRFKHRDDGMIARTMGLEPEECMKLVEEYADSKAREARLEVVRRVREEWKKSQAILNELDAIEKEIEDKDWHDWHDVDAFPLYCEP